MSSVERDDDWRDPIELVCKPGPLLEPLAAFIGGDLASTIVLRKLVRQHVGRSAVLGLDGCEQLADTPSTRRASLETRDGELGLGARYRTRTGFESSSILEAGR